MNLYALFANIRAGKYEPIPPLTPSGASYSENLRSLITAMIRIDPLTRPSMQQVAAVARKMVEQRLGKQMQIKENQAQAMQLHEEERRKAEAAAAASGGAASSAAQPAASASPASTPSLSASPPASTAAPTSAAASAAAVSPSAHLAVQFADGSPVPLTPTVSSLPVSRPLNASPLPSPDAVLAVASELAQLHNVPRAMSPISPILQRTSSVEQGSASASSAPAAAAPAAASSASPPVIVNRPPSATRPTSASRPISATHRPNSGAQRPLAPASAVGASNIAAAAPAPKIMSPPADRPSSKEGGLRPSSKESARPTSQSSARPSSGTRPSSGSKPPPSRSILQQQQDGSRAGTGVDHFPSSSSAAAVRPLTLRMASPSILSSLSDSRDEADESSTENGTHSPARLGRPGLAAVNPAGQSFLYDRASPSPSPKSAESGKGSFHLADPAHALAPVPEQSSGADYKGAHMSFAELPAADVTSPPPAGIESFRPLSATVAAARPLSRGAIHSAGTRQQPVLARPLSGTVASPPSVPAAGFGSTQQLTSPPPFLEEELSPDPKGPGSSPPPPTQKLRSITRDSPTSSVKSPLASNGSAALTSPVSRSGGDSSRMHRVKSASATEGSSAAGVKSPSRRLPLSHFTSPDSQDPAANGDEDDDLFLRPHANSAAATPVLPPRPVSVDAPQRPVPTPSALLVQSAALPFPSCEGMMEDTLEALKMLHYESRFCARWKLPWITREYFVHDFAAIWAKQNGRGKKIAASSRPGASAAATADEVKFAVSVSAVPPNPPPTQSQQLLYFGYLSLWLLSFLLRPSGGGKDAVDNEQLSSLLGELSSWREYSEYRDSDEGESVDRRSSLAATILSHLALVKLPLPSPGLSVDSLSTSASGEKLLQLLFRLTQAVYYKKLHGSVVLSPLALRHYPRFEPNPELAAREAEEDEEDDEVEEEEGAVEEETMDEAAANEEHDDPSYAPTSAQDQSFASAPQTDSERDAAARKWTEEFTRLSESSALSLNLSKVSASGVREWQMHREAVVKHAASLQSSPLVAAASVSSAASPSTKPSLTPSTLPLRSQELRRMLDKISAFEARLARDQGFKSLAEEYATVRSRLESMQDDYTTISGSNGSEHARLVALDESLAHTIEVAKSLRDSKDDGGGGLREIAKAMARLRREISQMNVAIGIKAAMIQTHRAAEQKQKAMQKQRT